MVLRSLVQRLFGNEKLSEKSLDSGDCTNSAEVPVPIDSDTPSPKQEALNVRCVAEPIQVTTTSPITNIRAESASSRGPRKFTGLEAADMRRRAAAKKSSFFIKDDPKEIVRRKAALQAQEMRLSQEQSVNKTKIRSRRLAEQNLKKIRQKCKAVISAHITPLALNYARCQYMDEYGKKRINSDQWSKKVDYFIDHVLADELEPSIFAEFERSELSEMIQLAVKDAPSVSVASSVDEMSGQDYEKYCAEKLNQLGWKTTLTAASGDQGIDIIAEKRGLKVAIQCKRYTGSVPNAAVQEVLGGQVFAGAQHAAVVSNARFTAHCRALAHKANVLLLHHDELQRLDSFL